jgi:Cu/Ag efflux protein CusF
VKRTAAFGAALALLLGGCRAREKPTPASSAGTNAPTRPAITAGGASSTAARRYPVRGVITSVDAAASRITVDHERIPGFMEAMTTPFTVRDDPRVIALLRPGDRIEATLVVEPGGFFLEQVLTKGFVPTPPFRK